MHQVGFHYKDYQDARSAKHNICMYVYIRTSKRDFYFVTIRFSVFVYD
jgi:hypothetical protein